MQTARELAASDSTFNIQQFTEDYTGEPGAASFRVDLQQVQYYRINRFPTLIFQSDNRKAILVSGYRPYLEVLRAVEAAFPALQEHMNPLSTNKLAPS